MQKKIVLSLLVPSVVTLLFVVLGSIGVFNTLDNRIYDLLLHLKPEVPQSKSILLLDIDNTAIRKVGEWPWSRSVMANGLITMREFGAREAVFDIEYVNQSPLGVDKSYLNKKIPSLFDQQFHAITSNTTALFNALDQGTIPLRDAPQYAKQLSKLDNKSRNILLGKVQGIARNNDRFLGQAAWFFHRAYFTVNFTSSSNGVSKTYRNWVLDHVALKNITVHGRYGHEITGLSPTIKPILSRAAGAGFPRVIVDSDGVRRRVDLIYKYRGKYFGQLMFRALLPYLGNPKIELYPRKIVLANAKVPGETPHNITIPLTPRGRFLINWPKMGYEHSFKHLSFYNLVLYHRQEVALLGLLHAMARANYLSFAANGQDFFAPYTEAQKIEKGVLAGGNPAAAGRFRSLRERFFRSAGQFLRGSAEQRILSQINGALASPQITAAQTKQFTAVRTNVKEKFAQGRRLDKAFMESRALLSKYLEGKICIIGDTATSSTDLGANPFVGQYPNVGTHAAIANTILEQRFVNVFPHWYSLVAAAVLAFLLYFLIRRLEPLPSIIIGALAIVAFLAIGVGIFLVFRIYLDMGVPSFTVGATYLVLILLKFLTTAREKSYIRNAFGRYLSGEVINELINDPEKLSLGGEKKYLTAFFSDVKGFSTISEQLDPTELVRLLNSYLTQMSDIILALRGTIDKYEGDAIISFFGAPVVFEEHAAHACRAALRIKRAEAMLNDRFLEQGLSPHPLLTRIGINTGEMVVGNMGTASKMDYTIMGNAVNLASRLEGVNKQYGTWILTGEATQSECGEQFLFRRLDRVRVVGIREPVRLYEVVAERDGSADRAEAIVERFEEALELFEEKHWRDAEEAFGRVLEIDANDGPASVFRDRCLEYLQKAPSPSWDGVFNLTTK